MVTTSHLFFTDVAFRMGSDINLVVQLNLMRLFEKKIIVERDSSRIDNMTDVKMWSFVMRP